MELKSGDKLGPYEILSPLGKGGMGEVWKAHDPRLRRDVAVKTSAEHFSERFEREAHAIAALNHSNICQIYDVGPNYLVMEYIEGTPLKGPLPLDQALKYGAQICEALDAAHRKGITHRDLKPANILATKTGIKLLDFGLARMSQPSAPLGPDDVTFVGALTGKNEIVGTLYYMSPEQLQAQATNQELDGRSDIFSFGLVLYELLTGKRAMEGASPASVIAAIMERPAPSIADVAPAALDRALKRCLEKDPDNRWQTARDLKAELEWIAAGPGVDPGSSGPHAHAWRFGSAGWVAAALAIAGALGVSFIHFRETPTETPSLRTTILPPENTTFDFTNGLGLPALSPDGKRIVFGSHTADGKNPLWVRSLDGLTAQPLAGTDGATFPFWSPDSRYIGFFADRKLKKMDASGGPAISLTDAVGARGGSWSSGGVIVFKGNTTGPLQRVSAAGGQAIPLPSAVGRLPWFLPDGQHFLFQIQIDQSLDAVEVFLGSLDGSPSVKVAQVSSNAIYSQGHLLYLRDGTLMARPFDVKRLALTGEEVPVSEQVQSVLNSRSAAVVAASATGLVAYRRGEGSGGSLLTWFDRAGKPGVAVGDSARFRFRVEFSPDRKYVAAESSEGGGHIWITDVMRGVRTRLTADTSPDGYPVWSPDGLNVVFSSNRKGHFGLYRRAANGSGTDELLYADNAEKIPTSWSPDGKALLYQAAINGPRIRSDVRALPLTPQTPDGLLKPVVVLQSPAREARFSPDGKWIVYVSAESGASQIYVTQFPPPLSGSGGKRQISKAGGRYPRWRQDGKEIFWNTPLGVMAAEVTIRDGAVAVGEERSLFNNHASLFDVSADGQHFLTFYSPEMTSQEPLTLIQNWTAGLRK